METIFEKYTALRKAYPDDIERIEAEEQRVSVLLKSKDYSELETTKELLALCRKDILASRVQLASVRKLTEEQRAEHWHIIEARLWFVKMVARNYEEELAQLDQDLERELHA